MEEGRIQEAEAEKNRLENMQRERRKKAEAMGHEQSPLWFRYVRHCSVGGQNLLSRASKALAAPDVALLTCERTHHTDKGRKGGWKIGAQELRESGGGRPGLPAPNSLDGLYGQKTALNRLEAGIMSVGFVSSQDFL